MYRFQPSAELSKFSDNLERLGRGMGSWPFLIIDITLMASGGQFIGNPMSSFSAVICGLRSAQGKTCVNSPPNLHPTQCMGYPDTRNMYLAWANVYTKKLRRSLESLTWNLTKCEGKNADKYKFSRSFVSETSALH